MTDSLPSPFFHSVLATSHGWPVQTFQSGEDAKVITKRQGCCLSGCPDSRYVDLSLVLSAIDVLCHLGPEAVSPGAPEQNAFTVVPATNQPVGMGEFASLVHVRLHEAH